MAEKNFWNEIYNFVVEEIKKQGVEKEQAKALSENMTVEIAKKFYHTQEREKLEIYYDYEKRHLELLKTYKEEIKFLNDQQMEIRKERTKFFAESLKQVANTLKEVQVDPKVCSAWIQELVKSYTQSLDLSNNLIEETTLNSISEMKTKAKQEKEKIESKEKNET